MGREILSAYFVLYPEVCSVQPMTGLVGVPNEVQKLLASVS